jgi:hypothetical protein
MMPGFAVPAASLLCLSLAAVSPLQVATDQRSQDALLASQLRTENRVCARWMPVLRKLQPHPPRLGGTDFEAAVRRSQPSWVQVPVDGYRDLLREWYYRLRVGVSDTVPQPRSAAAAEIDHTIADGAVRLWQARVGFLRIPGTFTVTRIGFADRTVKKRHRPDGDFAKTGYHYILSRGKPSNADINREVDGRSGYLFIDGGGGYVISPISNDILGLYSDRDPARQRPDRLMLQPFCQPYD